MNGQFAKTKGYADYGVGAAAMRAAGLEEMAKGYVNLQLWGTPDQILRKLEPLHADIGDTGCLTAVRFGGSSFEVRERSLKLFAKQVLPVIRDRDASADHRAAAE